VNATPPAPSDSLWAIVDALARVVALRNALESNYLEYAAEIAEHLELDLRALRDRLQEAA
jgi:hypothetical protein